MKVAKISSMMLVAVLTGCAATGPQVAFEGESRANERLRSDTYNMIAMVTAAKGCNTIEKIATSVLKEPVGDPGKEKTSEKWVAHGCNAQYPFAVTFTGDGAGGAYFSVMAIQE